MVVGIDDLLIAAIVVGSVSLAGTIAGGTAKIVLDVKAKNAAKLRAKRSIARQERNAARNKRRNVLAAMRVAALGSTSARADLDAVQKKYKRFHKNQGRGNYARVPTGSDPRPYGKTVENA